MLKVTSQQVCPQKVNMLCLLYSLWTLVCFERFKKWHTKFQNGIFHILFIKKISLNWITQLKWMCQTFSYIKLSSKFANLIPIMVFSPITLKLLYLCSFRFYHYICKCISFNILSTLIKIVIAVDERIGYKKEI